MVLPNACQNAHSRVDQSADFDLSSAKKTIILADGRVVVKIIPSIACHEGAYARIAPQR